MPSMPPPNQPAAPAPAPDPSVKLSKFKGLINTLDLERLAPEDLWQAINIDIDDDSQIHRRRGYTQVTNEPTHSLFTSERGVVYGVVNGSLSVINADYSTVALLAGVGDSYWSGGLGLDYYQIGTSIYFTGTSVAGIILETANPVVVPWGPADDFWLSPVVNPTATLPPIKGRLLGAPPRASYLTAYNGRMYIGQGSLVWATELYAYGLVDRTRNFMQFEGNVTLMGTVADGIYVGTTEGLWFLAGPGFPLKRVRVMDSPAIPRSMTYIPAELANPPQVGTQADTPIEVSIMFHTTRGVCVAMDGGKTLNLTESKFFFPGALRAAALFRRQDGMNQYISVLDAEGSPANGARIGAYVDATIVRGAAVPNLDLGAVVAQIAGQAAGQVVEPEMGSRSFEVFELLADETILAGMPVAISPMTGHLVNARSDTYAKSFVAGVATADIAASFVGLVATDAVVLSTWMTPYGATTLPVGSTLYLAPTGGYTATVPTTRGDSVVIIGSAVSANQLDLAITKPILL